MASDNEPVSEEELRDGIRAILGDPYHVGTRTWLTPGDSECILTYAVRAERRVRELEAVYEQMDLDALVERVRADIAAFAADLPPADSDDSLLLCDAIDALRRELAEERKQHAALRSKYEAARARIAELEMDQASHMCAGHVGTTYVYLNDGTKVRIVRGPDARGLVWLEVVPQDVVQLQSGGGDADK